MEPVQSFCTVVLAPEGCSWGAKEIGGGIIWAGDAWYLGTAARRCGEGGTKRLDVDDSLTCGGAGLWRVPLV
jgi:hypothetical protein